LAIKTFEVFFYLVVWIELKLVFCFEQVKKVALQGQQE
jgi:hypothetical protein